MEAVLSSVSAVSLAETPDGAKVGAGVRGCVVGTLVRRPMACSVGVSVPTDTSLEELDGAVLGISVVGINVVINSNKPVPPSFEKLGDSP